MLQLQQVEEAEEEEGVGPQALEVMEEEEVGHQGEGEGEVEVEMGLVSMYLQVGSLTYQVGHNILG